MTQQIRKALQYSTQELESFINEKMEKETGTAFKFDDFLEYYQLLTAFPDLEDDLQDVCFDDENYSFYQHLTFDTVNGVSFAGIEVAGDWELPIFFIIYIDVNKQLRAYIPKKGNLINPLNDSAFGNDEEEDEQAAKALGFKSYEAMENSFTRGKFFDIDKIREDVAENFVTVPGSL